MDTPLKESQQSLKIRQHLGVMFGIDLLVYTPKRLQERLDLNDWFIREVIEEGKVLYETSNS